MKNICLNIQESFARYMWLELSKKAFLHSCRSWVSQNPTQELCMLKGAVQGNQCNGVCGFGGQDLAGIISSLSSA